MNNHFPRYYPQPGSGPPFLRKDPTILSLGKSIFLPLPPPTSPLVNSYRRLPHPSSNQGEPEQLNEQRTCNTPYFPQNHSQPLSPIRTRPASSSSMDILQDSGNKKKRKEEEVEEDAIEIEDSRNTNCSSRVEKDIVDSEEDNDEADLEEEGGISPNIQLTSQDSRS